MARLELVIGDARIERLVSAMSTDSADESLLRAGIRNALQRAMELHTLVNDV